MSKGNRVSSKGTYHSRGTSFKYFNRSIATPGKKFPRT